MKINLFHFGFLILLAGSASGQTTIGLIQHSIGSLDDGYVLFPPTGSYNTYLIDKCGNEVKTWTSNYKPGHSCYLLSDGSLLRCGDANNAIFSAGGSGGKIEKFDWNGNVIWSYTVSNATKCQHHDVKALPNGNVLVIAWELKTPVDAIAQGRNPALTSTAVWSEQILEIQPVGLNGGNVVWEWHLWDHLIQNYDVAKPNYGQINSQPGLVNINYKASAINRDWIHMNSIDYNAALDQILVSAHAFNEIWIIDHSTTTAQAASHIGGNSGMGGDLLYRWGNPLAYNTGTTTQFYGQHNAHWIESGLPYQNQIMVFNNGISRPGSNYSTIEIINPPTTGFNYNSVLPYLPATPSWIYNSGNTNNFYAANISGAQQLSNGNVLFNNGPLGIFYEIDSTGNQVWEYINPVVISGVMTQGVTPAQNVAFRCNFYPGNYSGFTGHVLTATNVIENVNVVSNSCNLIAAMNENTLDEAMQLFPNPTGDFVNIRLSEPGLKNTRIQIFDLFGKLLLDNAHLGEKESIKLDLRALDAGCYLMKASSPQFAVVKKIIVNK